LQLIYEYYLKFPEVFHFINTRAKNLKADGGLPNWRTPIFANQIWQLDDPNKKAVEVYLWLIKKE
jgi:hypothetical protein